MERGGSMMAEVVRGFMLHSFIYLCPSQGRDRTYSTWNDDLLIWLLWPDHTSHTYLFFFPIATGMLDSETIRSQDIYGREVSRWVSIQPANLAFMYISASPQVYMPGYLST